MSYESYRDKVDKVLDESKRKALAKIGYLIEAEAKKECPVDTGRLRGSVGSKVIPEEDQVIIGTNVEYALYIEKGTLRQHPQSFLTPAAERNKEKIEKIAREAMRIE